MEFNLLAKKFAKTLGNDLVLDLLVDQNGPVITFFSLKGDKDRAGSLKLVEQCLVLESVVNLVIDLVELLPLLCFDEGAPLDQLVDD